jgi:hypothetical protein
VRDQRVHRGRDSVTNRSPTLTSDFH